MLRRLLVFVVVTVGIFAAGFFGLTRQFTVATNGMAPTVKKGDHVAVLRWFSSPGRKDIVVIGTTLGDPCLRNHVVLRIIGLPGETVSDRNGAFFVDGKPLSEPYVQAGRRDHRTQTWHVPARTYLLAGDNRRSPCGAPVEFFTRQVIGKVIFTYWPVDRIAIG